MHPYSPSNDDVMMKHDIRYFLFRKWPVWIFSLVFLKSFATGVVLAILGRYPITQLGVLLGFEGAWLFVLLRVFPYKTEIENRLQVVISLGSIAILVVLLIQAVAAVDVAVREVLVFATMMLSAFALAALMLWTSLIIIWKLILAIKSITPKRRAGVDVGDKRKRAGSRRAVAPINTDIKSNSTDSTIGASALTTPIHRRTRKSPQVCMLILVLKRALLIMSRFHV